MPSFFNGEPALTDVSPEEWARFWKFVDQGGDCWLWVGSAWRGYGEFRFRRRKAYVHRFVYRAIVGAIPPKHQIDHVCRNRRCVNPRHLEAVTQVENLRRSTTTRLTPDDVRRIYALADSGHSQASIARQTGLAPSYVCNILAGRAWKDVFATRGLVA